MYAAVAVGSGFACGLIPTGHAYCWGRSYGSSPQPVPGGTTFRSIAAGDTFACGVTPDDELFCWGSNDYGQLGTGNFVASNVPVRVADP
jgi:alpha-tubulin suppressor-like RCC1 family protein